ncbi:T9SS type A sorting domain-containing protein [Flavobacterium sp. ST-75]|uniref:T9SS type A sorting domain-containing protein n=1 Tax=Flavobacterium rhizophilum TaxID=3163296 RepID=A0ABW8YAN5_9FLAO
MKKKLLYLLLLFSGIASAQIVNIPDANFKNKLLSANTTNNIAKDINDNSIIIDTNGDYEIQESEALLVASLYLEGSLIDSLDGIEAFSNITNLNCRLNHLVTFDYYLPNLTILQLEYNDLTSLDVSGCANLINLNCRSNDIVSLNALGLLNLEVLGGENNQITTLNLTPSGALLNLDIAGGSNVSGLTFSDFPNLEYLDYEGNTQLSSEDISSLVNLKRLDCSGVGLTSLDLTGFTLLEDLYCFDNPLSSIVTDDLINLYYFGCSNTLLTELDLSHSPGLGFIHVNENTLLETININNGGVMIHPYECQFFDNPNFAYMCVDEDEEVQMLQYFEFYEQAPVAMSTDCVFNTNDDYNTIKGVLRFDGGSDGCGEFDPIAPFVKVKLNDGVTERIKFSHNYTGEYLYYVEAGDFEVTVDYEFPYYITSPTVANVSFPAMDNSVSVQDFCIEPNGDYNDVEVVMVPVTNAVPGYDAVYKIVYKNNGTQVVSGSVSCEWDYNILTYVSLVPMADDISLGNYGWNYTDLQPFESREILMTLHVNGPTDTPAVNIDDVLPFTAHAVNGTDDNPANNDIVFNQTVVGAFDPNNIMCVQGEVVPASEIGEYLYYVVNFENTGNASATFVVITQAINEEDYDVSSLQILKSSHSVDAEIVGNVVTFTFPNINLNALDHGNILFKLKSKSDLVEGDQVVSQANIVFDYNEPIVTNEAITEFEGLMGLDDFEKDNSVKVYPNPVKDVLSVEGDVNLRSVSLYDIQGRLLQTMMPNDVQTTLDISMRAKGIYFLKITSDKGVKVEKVIKE